MHSKCKGGGVLQLFFVLLLANNSFCSIVIDKLTVASQEVTKWNEPALGELFEENFVVHSMLDQNKHSVGELAKDEFSEEIKIEIDVRS
jgi:hypothetical protein